MGQCILAPMQPTVTVSNPLRYCVVAAEHALEACSGTSTWRNVDAVSDQSGGFIGFRRESLLVPVRPTVTVSNPFRYCAVAAEHALEACSGTSTWRSVDAVSI